MLTPVEIAWMLRNKAMAAGGASVTLGPARITEQGLGPPVGMPGADTLYAFMAEDGSEPVDHKASPTAAALNDAGHPLQAEVAAILKHFMTWNNAFALIQEDQKKGGGLAALKSVKDAAGAIGENARGSGGSGMREATKQFYGAVTTGKILVEKLQAQVDKLTSANLKVTAAFGEDAVHKANRVVQHNKDAVTEEEKNIEDKKKKIEGYFSLAEKLLKPQEWSEAVLTVSLFADEQLTSALVASTDKLQGLRNRLEESEQQLASLEDATQADKILSEQQAADSEMHNLAAGWEEFDQFCEEVKAAQKDIVEQLDNPKSPAMELAAQAVVKRDAISKQAANAASMVRGYLAEVEPLLKSILHLGERYRSYVSVVGQYGKGAPEYLDSLSKTAKRNADTCQEFADYIRVTRVQAKEGLDYLTKDTDSTFLAGYNEIPKALRDAVANRPTGQGRSAR